MHLLFGLSTAFTLWMLYDAMQRGCPAYWMCIICVPFGEFAYFFAVKIHDFEGWAAGPSAPVDVDTLRHQLRENPCVDHHVQLAEALFANGETAEALELCETAVRADDSYLHARYGRARCHMRLGQWKQAEEDLAYVVARDRAFDDRAAWIDLAEARRESGDVEAAVETLRELVAADPRLEHQTLLAQHLSDAGRDEEASRILAGALEAAAHAPPHLQRLQKDAVRRARQLLDGLG